MSPYSWFYDDEDGSDYKEEFSSSKLLLFVTWLDHCWGGMEKLEKLNQEAKAKGYIVMEWRILLTKKSKSSEKMPYFDFYTCDAIALKTIERANQVL
jgi:hypothetical protein